jgi:hypothetical protein
MAIICRKYNFLFIMTPRTACTAIGELLCERYGGEFLPADDILDSKGRIAIQKKHSTLKELLEHKILSAEESKSLLKVATVRNPFDTLVSLYFKQRYKYQPLLSDPTSWVNRSPAYARNMRYAQTHSFSQWLLKKCAKQLAKTLLGAPLSMFRDYTCGMDVVMRYENLSSELDAVFKRLGMPKGVAIPDINRTNERAQRDYRPFYSRASALAVQIAFWSDLKHYSYKFHDVDAKKSELSDKRALGQ